MFEERILIRDAFKSKEVSIAGWVEEFRDLNKIKFIILRDFSGTIQITLPKSKVDSKIFNITLTKESVVSIKGTMIESKQARGGKELIPKEIEIISEAESPLPIDISGKIETDLSKRLDWRFLDLRNPKIAAIFRIQSEICKLFREFFIKKDFTEIWPPGIISMASEGGTELFPVIYFNKSAYLAQSPQIYKQLLTLSKLERVFSINPVWRAEPHDTSKHINEVRQMDIEIAFADEKKAMKLLEEVIIYIIKNIKNNCKEELKFLNRDLKIPSVEKLRYEEIIKRLKKNNFKIEYGDDISSDAEKKISEIFGDDVLIFIDEWPIQEKPFYIMPKDSNISKGFDLEYGGRELASGGQRIHDPVLLKKRIKECGLDPSNFEFYINSFKYGSPPHSGWSIGLERLTMAICGLNNIREACLFPRDRERLNP